MDDPFTETVIGIERVVMVLQKNEMSILLKDGRKIIDRSLRKIGVKPD